MTSVPPVMLDDRVTLRSVLNLIRVTILVVIVSGISNAPIDAAPPSFAESKIQRIDVPADRPAAWSNEAKSLIAIPRNEFEQLLSANEAEQPAPRPAQLTTAHYSATLTGQALRDGRARLTVQRVGSSPVLLPLGQFNLAVRSFSWVDREAVWGTDESGFSWLLADQPKGEIQMNWSAAGRLLADELHFDLQLPAAAISTIDLRLPRDQVLRATPEARRIDEGSDANWQTWRIHAGSERRCRVAITPTRPKVDQPPSILFEHELGAIVREQDLRFQTVFQVEVFDTPVTELTFTVPASVDVYAVTYGQDVSLTWTRPNKAEATGTMQVRLPGPLLGRSRPIRIDGVAVQKPNSPMVSPQIAVKGGVFTGGRHTLTIVAPLQLRSFRPSGFRQQTPATLTPDGESYTFVQMLPDAQLVLDVGRPQASLAAQAHCLFEMSESTWTLVADLTWTASSGGVFQTECQFPSDWEITDVRLPTELGTARLAGWDLAVQSGGQSLLTIEFLEALAPTVPRTIRVLARRRPVAAGTSIPVPLPHPTNCHSVESMLGLVVPAEYSPYMSDDARLERVSTPDVMSSLTPRKVSQNQSEYWFRRESTDGGGSMQLVSRLRRVAASNQTVIVATPGEYLELYRIRCTAEGAPIDRLLVYLTQPAPPGAEIRWSIVAPRQGELIAHRLPVAQHVDWSCPEVGELWELRLPPIPAGSIQIEGRRENRWNPVSRPALLVVPQSMDRKSQVVLRHPGSLDLLIDSTAMDVVPAKTIAGVPEDPAVEPPSAVEAISNERVLEWSFENPAASLSLTLKNPERSREFPTMVSLRLRSLLSSNPQGFDLYRAQIRLENGTASDELRILLPPAAALQQVTIAGQATVPNYQGDELLLSDLDATRRDVVELLYRVPSKGGGIRDVHRIMVPQISATVLGFTWEFALPPTVKIYSEPVGVRLTHPLSSSSWTEKLFGPLGRSGDEAFFNPFAMESWREFFNQGRSTDSGAGDFTRELIAPAEWHVHESISALVPTEIILETWQTRQTRLLAWIALVVNLMLGILVRMVGWKYRDRLAAYWLALMASGACFAPSPYAEMFGGAIAGTVIALLSPRKSLISQRREPSLVVPMGSTHSFDWGAPASVMLLIGLTSAVAQEPSISVPPLTQLKPAAPRFPVLVPVDADGKPSTELPLVYLPQKLLTTLKESARIPTQLPRSLIASASYNLATKSGGADSLQAKFKVHLLDRSGDHQILLPVTEAFLTGMDACRINGNAHPAQIAPDGRGFRITWNAKTDDDAQGPQTLDIELDLKRVGTRNALGGSFQSKVPGVAASHWTMKLPESVVFFEATGVQGATDASADKQTFDIDLGSTTTVDVRWSQSAPESRVQRLEVSQLQSLDLRSTHGELRFRMRCEPTEGQFDFVEFDLPPRSLVREGDIRATNMLRSELTTDAQGTQRLRIVFSEPQRSRFTIDGTIQLAMAEGIAHLPLPQIAVTKSPGTKVTTIQNWWCVSSPPEYRLEHQNLEVDLLGAVSSADFLQAWGDSPPTGRLQLLFQPREASTAQFTVSPQVPRRRVLSWSQTGTIGRRRLEWTVNARLETSQAPVYQHFLLVDRRLQIESISVIEGGAERLVRWSENRVGASPTRVVLFLSDKTTGIQQLVLKGSLPTRYGRVTPLPFVRCEEAELVESRWELFHEQDVEVDLTLPRGVPDFEPDETVETDGKQLVARYQTADPDPKTSIRVSAVQARCTVRAAAALTRGEGTTWKLAGQLKLAPEGESPRRMGVLFPATYDPARVRVDRAEANWHEPVDGRRRLDLTLMPDPGEVLISFESVIDEPSKGDWELPFPEPQEAISQQIHLMISPADAWTPLEGTELKPDELPVWAEEILDEYRSESTAAEYQLASLPIRLRRNQSITHMEHPEIRLIDHSLWLTEQGGRFGVTRAYLSQTRDSIQFEVPDGFQMVATFLDERPLPLPVPVDGKLLIPLAGGGRESLLVLNWEQPTPQSTGLARIQNETLPKAVHIDVTKTLVTVIPFRDGMTIIRDGSRDLDWMDAALDRLEMLLGRQESLGSDPRAAAANRRLIFDLQLQITARLPKGLARSDATMLALLDRWNRMVPTLNQLEPSSLTGSITSPEQRGMQLNDQFVDLPHAMRVAVSLDNPSVNFWMLDRRWVNGVGACLLCLVAIPLFRRLIRLEWGEWLSARTSIAWLLLGLVWWLWLTPGPVGPAIVSAAIVRMLIYRRQAQNSVLVVES